MSVSAKQFKGRIGSTPIAGLYKTDVGMSGDELDATDAENTGFAVTEVGLLEIEVSLTGNHKSNAGPWPGMTPGQTIASLSLYPHGIGGGYWQLTNGVITKANNSGEVRGKVEWTATVKLGEGGSCVWVG